jgi:hypothetical protein
VKLIFCEVCGDIVAPDPVARRVRECACGTHAVWWEDPQAGQLRVCYKSGHKHLVAANNGAPRGRPEVFVVGISNAILQFKGDAMLSADAVQAVIDQHPESYIFRKARSLVIRIRPGDSNDTAWSALPA